MTYTPKFWKNKGEPGAVPVLAEDANRWELGIAEASQAASETASTLNQRLAIDPVTQGVPNGGTQDASAALQAVVNGAPAGAVIQARAGDYFRLDSPVVLSRAVTLAGGTYRANPTGPTFVIAASRVHLTGLSIVGPGADLGYWEAQQFITSTGTSSNRLRHVSITDVTMTGCRSSAMWLSWLTDFTIRRVLIEDFQYAGIMLLSPKRGIVDSCVIRTARMDTPLVNAYGIAATDIANTLAGRAEDILITGNTVEGVLLWEGIDTHGGLNIRVIGNTLLSCRQGISIVTGNASRVAAPQGCVVSDNVIIRGTASDTSAGIGIEGTASSTLADVTVGPNVIRGYTRDMIVNRYQPASSSIVPQATDASNRRTPSPGPFRSWTGEVTVEVSAGSGFVDVPFPAGLFTVAPHVQLTKTTGTGARTIPYVSSVTTSQCRVSLYDPAGTTAATVTLSVTATQASPTSATGVNQG